MYKIEKIRVKMIQKMKVKNRNEIHSDNENENAVETDSLSEASDNYRPYDSDDNDENQEGLENVFEFAENELKN